jgi:hypothetical protein
MLAYLDTFIGFAVVMLGASLLITILVQTVSAVAAFRGSSLRWGLQQLFEKIDPSNLPTINTNAAKIAEEILTHNLTSDSIFSSLQWVQKVLPKSLVKRFQLASAIRCDELVGTLNQWMSSATPPLGIPASELKSLLEAPNPAVERSIKLLTETSAALKALPLNQAPALIEETVKSLCASGGKLDAWFKTTMDRVSQQFSMYMRTWTVIFSFALAAIVGLDAIQLITSLYQKGDFRAAVVGAAPNLLDRAQKILPLDAKSNKEAVANAMTNLFKDTVSRALTNAKVTIDAEPKDIKTSDEAEAWIRRNVTDPSQQKAVLDAFPAAADQAFADYMKKNAKNASDVEQILISSGIQIGGWANGFSWKQLLGVLISGALLSLGAPFWFNSLKSLTNLRTAVAGKLKEEEKKSS